MVGVPRSKGCLVCRRRSVKCDEIRPSCSQCRKGGRKCSGYDLPMKFISHYPKASEQNRGCNSINQLMANPNAVSSPERMDARHIKSSARSSFHQQAQKSPMLQIIRIYNIYSPDLNRSQLIASFISDIFPPKGLIPQLSFFGDWLWCVPQYITRSRELDHAAHCLALAYFARESGSATLLQMSRHAYSKALWALSRAISDIAIGLSSETLCATMLLSIYEMFMCTEKTSWIKHAGGAGRLMQIRGAHRHKEGFDYTMFLGFRAIIVAEAMASRGPCFLDSDDWRAVVTENSRYLMMPEPFYHCNEFCNYLAAIPGLVSQVASIVNKDPKSTLHATTLADAQRLRTAFHNWRWKFISSFSIGEPAFVEKPSTPYSSLFPVMYTYSSTSTGTMLCSYYASIIVLNTQISSLHVEDVEKENRDLVEKICMSVEYCLQAGICGVHCLTFALPIAFSVCQSEWRGWIRETLERI